MNLLKNPKFTSTYSVTRQAGAGAWVQGRWVDASSPSVVTVRASVQRLTAKETELLPEAYRTRESYRVYTESELFTVDNVGSKNCDFISIDGKNYDIVSREKWTQLHPHYKCIAVRREEVAL
jgi:hypothetical protein